MDTTCDQSRRDGSDGRDSGIRDDQIRVRFWGVRGSIPSPGPNTARYGGNTSCVTIEGTNAVDGVRRIGILDAGTGIRKLGQSLLADDADIILLLSHTHWDHIQGFPFFAPLYQPNRRIFLSRREERKGLFRLLLEQMDGTRFPLTQEQMLAHLENYSDLQIQDFAAAGYLVSRLRVNHPGETYGFRADLRGVSVVYIPDNEIDPPYPPLAPFDRLVAFCRKADVLIHDAQYTENDMPLKRGWGHSVVRHVWQLAAASGVSNLLLFHHDPDRTDDELDALQRESNTWFAENAPRTRCLVAREGMEILLSAVDDAPASPPILPPDTATSAAESELPPVPVPAVPDAA